MKPTKCKIKAPGCEGLYIKWSISQKCCKNIACTLELVRRDKEKPARKAYKAEKIRLKTRREWVADTQKIFNAFIRERDKNEPCICCGEWPEQSGKYGGDWDAGHFLSVGAHPEKRFLEDNCHRQLKSCNAGSGKYTHKGKTVSQAYRERLILKIGLERVESLECDNEPRKYSKPDLHEIQRVYKLKLKELVNGN